MPRVHVPAVEVRRDRGSRPVDRRDADLAAERDNREADAGQELGPTADPRNAGDPERGIGKVVRHEAEAGNAGGPAPVGGLELEQIDLEGVAWLGADDGDRAVDLVDAAEVEPSEILDGRAGGD